MTQPGVSDIDRRRRIDNILDEVEGQEAAYGSELHPALRLAVSALDYMTDANTLLACKTTARGALLGIEKELRGDA